MLEEKKYKDKTKLLAKIKGGNRQVLRKVYEDYRELFGKWARKHFQCDEKLIVEAYHTAVIIFYYHVKEEKINNRNANITTYIMALGKNILVGMLDESSEMIQKAEKARYAEIDHTLLDCYRDESNKSLINGLLNQIGEPCKTVLELYYLKEYTMEDIAFKMGYQTNEAVAKRKFICLQQMRKLMQEMNANK